MGFYEFSWGVGERPCYSPTLVNDIANRTNVGYRERSRNPPDKGNGK